MKEGRRLEWLGRSPDSKLRRMPHTKAAKFKSLLRHYPAPHHQWQAWKGELKTLVLCVAPLLFGHCGIQYIQFGSCSVRHSQFLRLRLRYLQLSSCNVRYLQVGRCHKSQAVQRYRYTGDNTHKCSLYLFLAVTIVRCIFFCETKMKRRVAWINQWL